MLHLAKVSLTGMTEDRLNSNSHRHDFKASEHYFYSTQCCHSSHGVPPTNAPTTQYTIQYLFISVTCWFTLNNQPTWACLVTCIHYNIFSILVYQYQGCVFTTTFPTGPTINYNALLVVLPPFVGQGSR